MEKKNKIKTPQEELWRRFWQSFHQLKDRKTDVIWLDCQEIALDLQDKMRTAP